ncbi:hypothetical protein CSH63_04905 [Micromonospora tulbaghiae]|uniref:Uncharacterized protein n=1 Tax=Micromonospora tulbaghiae TaxID=479978 RepID=A0A386WGK1_9ACTN|nr:hypothetical protein CSH63_04905 [Micromonospora tulbaghiae]
MIGVHQVQGDEQVGDFLRPGGIDHSQTSGAVAPGRPSCSSTVLQRRGGDLLGGYPQQEPVETGVTVNWAPRHSW